VAIVSARNIPRTVGELSLTQADGSTVSGFGLDVFSRGSCGGKLCGFNHKINNKNLMLKSISMLTVF
jgi:hypothetical protein